MTALHDIGGRTLPTASLCKFLEPDSLSLSGHRQHRTGEINMSRKEDWELPSVWLIERVLTLWSSRSHFKARLLKYYLLRPMCSVLQRLTFQESQHDTYSQLLYSLHSIQHTVTYHFEKFPVDFRTCVFSSNQGGSRSKEAVEYFRSIEVNLDPIAWFPIFKGVLRWFCKNFYWMILVFLYWKQWKRG